MLMVDSAGLIVMVNTRIEQLFGYQRAELIGQPVEMLLPARFRGPHGEHRRGFAASPLAKAMSAGPDLFGLRKDGTELPVEIGLNSLSTPDGEFVLGSVADIAERRAAERDREDLLNQVQHLAGRLIVAQDAERARIARDLHDDLGQRLAGLVMEFTALQRRLSALSLEIEVQSGVAALKKRALELTDAVRRISGDLHPSGLKHSGLVSALTAYSTQLSRDKSVEVVCEAEGDFESIEPALTLCFYRVAQEALHNVVSHARATRAAVRLRRMTDRVEMTIVDNGQGFELEEVMNRRSGLGLLSIKERVRLAHGSAAILTEKGKGTRVHVSVPVE
jgi:PAS domain S-box-containing protein